MIKKQRINNGVGGVRHEYWVPQLNKWLPLKELACHPECVISQSHLYNRVAQGQYVDIWLAMTDPAKRNNGKEYCNTPLNKQKRPVSAALQEQVDVHFLWPVYSG